MYKINFYKTVTGRSPVEQFIARLDERTGAKVARYIALLERKGPDLGLPFSRAFGGGLFELRIQAGQSVRVFYIFQQGQQIVLLHAILKTTQKTPLEGLTLALKRKKELTSV